MQSNNYSEQNTAPRNASQIGDDSIHVLCMNSVINFNTGMYVNFWAKLIV